MVLSVESVKFEDVKDNYKDVKKDSNKNAEDKLTSACSRYSKAPAKVISQIGKIVNALSTYRTGTITNRIKIFNKKQSDFEKAVAQIKQIFDDFDKKDQKEIDVKSAYSDVTATAIDAFGTINISLKEEDLPKVWSDTESRQKLFDTVVLKNLTEDEYKAIEELADKIVGTYNMDLVKAVQISSYMITFVLPSCESTIYKMVQVYLDVPESFATTYGFSMYNVDESGTVTINEIGFLKAYFDGVMQEYMQKSGLNVGAMGNVNINEIFDTNLSATDISKDFNNYFINQKMGVVQKIKLEETGNYSSEGLAEYSTSGLSKILKQVQLDNITARIDLSPTSELILTGKNENGNFEVSLDQPASFAILGSDDNGFEVFGMGNFYYVKFDDLEINKTPFNLYYAA